MSSDKKQIQSNNMSKADVKKLIRAAPNNIKPNHVGEFVVSSVPGLGACITIVIAPSAGHATQLVIHRPIGWTDLDAEKDWVMSMSSDIDGLLARRTNPEEGKIRAAQQKNRTHFLVSKSLLEEKDGAYYYPGVAVCTRNEYLDQADRALVIAKKEKKASLTSRRVDYLPDPVREHEFAIMEVLKTPEAKAEIEKDAVSSFRTRGGPLENQNQEAIVGLHGRSLAEVYATFPKLMLEGIGRGNKVELRPVTTVSKGPDVDVKALEARIEQKYKARLAEAEEEAVSFATSSLVLIGELYKFVDGMKTAKTKEGLYKSMDDLVGKLHEASAVFEEVIQKHGQHEE